MTRIALIVTLAFAALPVAHAQTSPAPFGLTWGMSVASLTKVGFTPTPNNKGPIKTYSSASVPKAWSGAEAYVAIVYNGHLVKVAAIGKDIKNDVGGTDGKKAYEHIKGILTQKYGQPSSNTEETGNALYKDYDEFYQCLDYTGCGIYVTIFKVGGDTIALQLKGKTRGEGYLTLQYESPAFAPALKAIAQSNAKSDSGAL